jgi:hypothetical protein
MPVDATLLASERHERWLPGVYAVFVDGGPDVWFYAPDGWQRTTHQAVLHFWDDPSFSFAWYLGDPLPPPQVKE